MRFSIHTTFNDNSATGNFHLRGGSVGDLNSKGTPIASLTTDFEGQTRNATYPYIGADEVTTLPLSVELVSFTASAEKNGISLEWQTATEVNNFGFEVEKTIISEQSLAISWSKIGFVEGSGTTNVPKEYSFSGKRISSGKYSYRLKQIDRDGKVEYSKSSQVEITIPRQFSLSQNYPNPFNPATMVEFTLPENGRATLKVFNTIGQEVATLFAGEVEAGRIQQARFDASRLPSGVYFSRLQFGGSSLVKKMILMK